MRGRYIRAVVAGFTLSLTSGNLQAQSLVSVETVRVSNAGNSPDATGYGSVASDFGIGKYEVTLNQYAVFLNAVARFSNTVTALNLWQLSMQDDTWSGGIARTGNGSSSDPYIYEVLGDGNRPVTYVDWFDAARFCNWLHNGAGSNSDTESGAYVLNGATNGIFGKTAIARWWIPTENEWYKAAYYDGASKTYWAYPNRKDTMAVGEGNFYSTEYAVDGPGDNKLSPVGFYADVASYYGTFDQAGNVWEWNDAITSPSMRGIRGGGWPKTDEGDPDVRNAIFRDNGRLPTDKGSYLGFRVATMVPQQAPTPVPVVDRKPPNLRITQPRRGFISTRERSYIIRGTATDNVSPTRIQFRIKMPRGSYGSWSSTRLAGGNAKTKSWSRSVTVNRRGKWTVQIRAFDAAGNSSSIRTVIITRL